MDYNHVKQCFVQSPELAGLDDVSAALLFWRGEELILNHGEVIYEEGVDLDESFCLLLEGELVVTKDGEVIGGVAVEQVFGEMAYFCQVKKRTATVSVGSPEATVLKFQMASEEMQTVPFAALKEFLGIKAWERFVSDTQGPA